MNNHPSSSAILLRLIVGLLLGATAAGFAVEPRFVDVAKEAGVSFRHESGMSGRYHYPEIMGAGVILFDYDGDDDLDIYFLNGNYLSDRAPDPAITNALYRNDSDKEGIKFSNVTSQAGISDSSYGQGGEAADFDGDGDVDLFVSNLGEDVFFRNNGDETFARVAMPNTSSWGQTCSALDFDSDGDLDLFVSNYLAYDSANELIGTTIVDGKKVNDYRGPQKFAGSASRLWRNDGEFKFVDATRNAGLFKKNGKGMGLACVDFDGDGAVDIYEANDSTENFLFMKRKNRFEEMGLISGCAVSSSGTSEASMGVDVADLNGDGKPELMVPCLNGEIHTLYGNKWPWFDDISVKSRLHLATRNRTGFSPNFLDYDNDSDLDLFISCGRVRLWSNSILKESATFLERYGERQVLLENDGLGQFSMTGESAGPYFQAPHVGRGSAVGDLNNDGLVDIVVTHANAAPAILINKTTTTSTNRLTLNLVGKPPNRDAIGARVILKSGGRLQYRWVRGGGGYLSVNDRRVHFGLGQAKQVPQIEITWPSGAKKVLRDVPAGQSLKVTED